jgi:uncharacterized membrane-anchored protein
MHRLAEMLRRIPRVLVFATAALIQVALIAAMVFDRARILRDGSEIMLQTRPVDPRDFLRGDYVVLSYDISSLPARALQGKPAPGRRPTVYVKLAPKADGFYEALAVDDEPMPVSGNEVMIEGHATSGTGCGGILNHFCERLTIAYGLEQFFVPEGEGRELEKARNEGKVAVVAAVTRSGRAAIKRLLLDGKPVYDEPMF